MTKTSAAALSLALALIALPSVQAQTTRAAVKADTAASAATQPKGELSTATQATGEKPAASTTSRAEVKKKAIEARKSGAIATGEQSTPRQGKAPMTNTTSGKTRAEVKAEAVTAAKQGGDKGGQSSQKDQDKGVTKP